ncbi:MAG: hypothetical protein KME55_12095 [Nostoc indistinguendum CM1-VF10]|nr:hypothetical protein [Nostoc indistinguendum CM1-VF10]
MSRKGDHRLYQSHCEEAMFTTGYANALTFEFSQKRDRTNKKDCVDASFGAFLDLLKWVCWD